MKIDPYNHQEKWLRWKEKSQSTIPGISQKNSELIIKYQLNSNLCKKVYKE